MTVDDISKASHDSITFWQEPNDWVTKAKADLLNRNVKLIKTRLHGLKENGADFFVSVDGLNPFMYKGKSLDKYFNNCGEAIREKYPVMNLIMSNKVDGELTQDHFEFLRTDDNYKLISVTIRNGRIK